MIERTAKSTTNKRKECKSRVVIVWPAPLVLAGGGAEKTDGSRLTSSVPADPTRYRIL